MVAPHRFPMPRGGSVLICCCIAALWTDIAPACTAFCLRDDANLVVGMNDDYFQTRLDDGLILVNQRNVSKRSISLSPTDKPARWISRYGSVTFNMLGKEFAEGGMNEAGLVLLGLSVPKAQYPDSDSRAVVMSWIQYQLDNQATIQEVLASDQKVRIIAGLPLLFHVFACDRQGQVATFEFLEGELVTHRGDNLPVPVLTNDTYEDSIACLKGYIGFGGTRELPWGAWGSQERFVCAADRVRQYRTGTGQSALAYAFDTLEKVRIGDSTKRMTVYDVKNMEIHYRTLRYPKLKTIRVADFDYSGRQPLQTIVVNTGQEGLLNASFHRYEADLNRWLTHYMFKSAVGDLPDFVLDILADYVEAPGAYYLTDWEVAGPYAETNKTCTELFDVPFAPERPEAKPAWKPLAAKLSGKCPAYLDLAESLQGGSQKAAYLRTPIECDREERWRLEIASDDGVKAWLEGKLIHANNVLRGMEGRPDIVDVTLKKGTNHLMLKVTQNEGLWGACVRVLPAGAGEPAAAE
jgi:penicillin V acylase-like amidase (Ntn superfamily)